MHSLFLLSALVASARAQGWRTIPQQCGSGADPTIPIDPLKYPLNGQAATIVPGDTEARAAFDAIMSGPLASVINSTPIKRVDANGAIITSGYASSDPDCWWTSTLCQVPNKAGLPADIFQLAPAKTWGLTIDDGPDCDGEAMYDFLDSKQQLATAFFVGGNVLSYPDQARRIFRSGHEIAGHSWSHNAMTTLSHESLFAEIWYNRKVIKEVTGVSITTFRCPYGDVDNRARAFLKALGIEYISWSRDTNDWTAEDAAAQKKANPTAQSQADYDEIIAAVSSTHGEIVLHHETSSFTFQLLQSNYDRILSVFAAMVPVTVGRNIAAPYPDSSCRFPSFAQYQAGQRGNCNVVTLPSSPVSSAPPAEPTASPTGACTSTYTIKAGDFCYAIATSASPALAVEQLTALNPGLNCNTIQPGQTLCLARAAAPVSSASSSSQPPSSSSPSIVQPPSSAPVSSAALSSSPASSVQPPSSSSPASAPPASSSAPSSSVAPPSSISQQSSEPASSAGPPPVPSSAPASSIEQPSSSAQSSNEPASSVVEPPAPSSAPQSSLEQPSSFSSAAPPSIEPSSALPSSAPGSSEAVTSSIPSDNAPSSISSSAPSAGPTAGPAPSGMTYACPAASLVGFGGVVQTIVGNALICVYFGSPLRRHRRQVEGGTCTYDATTGGITDVEGAATCPQVATLVAVTISSAPAASSSAASSSAPTTTSSSAGAGPTIIPGTPSQPPADNGIDPHGPRCTAGPGEIARKWWRRKHRRNRGQNDDKDDTSIPGNPVIIPVPRPDGAFDCDGEDGPELVEEIEELRPESSEQPWPEVSVVVPGEGSGVVPGVGAIPVVVANGTNAAGPARLPVGGVSVAPSPTPSQPPNSSAHRLIGSTFVGAVVLGLVLVV